MVYARSKVITKLLIKSYKNDKKKFTVIVVDNPPFNEGKQLLKDLCQEKIPCIYTLLSHVAYIMKMVNKVFVGASAMLNNGCLLSRVGTALVIIIHLFILLNILIF